MLITDCKYAAVFAVLIAVVAGAGMRPGPLVRPTTGQVWPRPNKVVTGSRVYVYDPAKIKFQGEGERCPLINTSVVRYRYILQRQARGPLHSQDRFTWRQTSPEQQATLDVVQLRLLGKCESQPYLGMDESYKVTVNDSQSLIEANTVWGLMRGLETFSQLSFFNNTLHQLTIRESEVWDKPRFSHRGLMVDTARHYLHKRTLKTILEAMEANKMNVLHWHMTDDQSFPYKSKAFPQLSEKGAYDLDKVYSSRDIKEMMEFARLRGIRVIPEFDTPGHTASWGPGKPDLLSPCYDGTKKTDLWGPVDPSNEDNYSFLEQLLSELRGVFSDQHFHFGGDEVDFTCWQSNPKISDFMRKKGIAGDYAALESLYIRRLLETANKMEFKPIVWQEVFQNDKSLDNDTVVHIWTGDMKTLLTQVTGNSKSALLSTCWYLDHFSQDIYAGGGDWTKFYNCEPLDFPGSQEMKSRVLGGEACMWGEYVDDTNVIQRIWPRASSAAERLWSFEFNVTEAARRLEEHVCRLRSRGIRAQPPNGPSTC